MVTNYVSKLFDVFIRDRIDREPHSLKYVYTLNLAYKVQNFSDYSAQYLLEQGHPTAIFGKISVRKTIWDLEFSEHLL